ncbi:MAG: DUF1800 domain-containing protein [Chitinophagaceae bacterium]|nr:DUF1800 domain-containing protein [Chitinophagaceae bacterium]
MGQDKVSRRKFFESLRQKEKAAAEEGFFSGDYYNEDPLFEKYSRKKLGPREYKTEEISYEQARLSDDALRVGNVTSGVAAYSGAWSEWEVLHLLRRTGYGFKKSYVDLLLGMTPSAAVDHIMNINTTPPAPPVNWYNIVYADENALPYGADWTTNFFTTGSVGQTSNSYRNQAMRRWLFGQMLNSDETIREKMTWFWYHFIPIDFDDVFQSSNTYVNTNSARIFYSYFKLMRDNALGNFKTLIRQISVEPAMMFYLNNQKNSATAPDENYARELMELFTLGKDQASQYTQSDVVEAAKVLTGWRVQGLNTANIATNFVTGSHSYATKQFSAFFNNQTISSVSPNGAGELDALINMIFSKSDVVSKYICRRLYRYFVYYDIDANIEANVITPLAQTFVSNNWDILPVLKQLFKSQHFFDVANRGVYIKTPFDLVAGSLRAFNVNTTVSDPANYQAQYQVWNYYNDSICMAMEQRTGSIPNVSGWNPFYQTPAFHQYWINTNTIQKRFKFLQDIFNGYNLTYNTLTTNIKVNVIAFAQQFDNATCADPNLLVAAFIKYLIPIDLSAAQQTTIKLQTLLSGQTTDSYWTTAWNNYIGAPTNTTYTNTVTTRLKSLLTAIVQLAEYQLM